ncbi:MAG: branched-chain amino acid transport system ATP-binding protein livM, partial [Actinomycetota bacterium]|nr:branched-chain amino acid transport system ATP-binding protein livM [Actinomycetota bacterium]
MARLRNLIPFLVLAGVLAMVPLVLSTSLVNMGVYALIFGLAAIGLSLLMGLAGQVSLGHAAFFAVGAYVQAILVTKTQVPGVLAAVIAVAASMLVALLVGLPLLRLRGHFLALATLGLGIIVSVVVRELEVTGGTSGIFGIPKPSFGGREYDTPQEFFWLLVPFVVVGLLLAHRLVRSRTGRALGAVNDSEVAAECLGVNTYALRLRVFVLAAGYAGLAGVFYAHWLAVVSPEAAGFELSVQLLLMVVLGGLGTVWGAVIGAVAVEALGEGMRSLIPLVIPGASGEVQLLGFGLVLVLLVVLLPGGLAQLWARLAARRGLSTPTRLSSTARSAAPYRPFAATGNESGSPDPGSPEHGNGDPGSPDPGNADAATDYSGQQALSHLLAEADVTEPGSPLLSIRGITKRYGGVTALADVDLDVRAGEILALIGPNGAGKTTAFNIITGVLAPTAGIVALRGT